MRVQVNLQNILDYSLDTLTGNTRQDLLARAAELERDGFDMFVNIPDAEGGDTEAPEERNIFKHHAGLPEPGGGSHEQTSIDLADQLYLENPCNYKRHVIIESGDIQWICKIHEMPSKHSIDKDSHAPCLTMDPYKD